MKNERTFATAFLVALFMAMPLGCGDDDGGSSGGGTGGADEEGLRMCCELGALCHRTGETSGPRVECHELGHENDPAACRANYDRCIALCNPAEGGAGGGGTPGSSPHACL